MQLERKFQATKPKATWGICSSSGRPCNLAKSQPIPKVGMAKLIISQDRPRKFRLFSIWICFAAITDQALMSLRALPKSLNA